MESSGTEFNGGEGVFDENVKQTASDGETGKEMEMFGGIRTALEVETGIGGGKTRRNKSAKNKRNKSAKNKRNKSAKNKKNKNAKNKNAKNKNVKNKSSNKRKKSGKR